MSLDTIVRSKSRQVAKATYVEEKGRPARPTDTAAITVAPPARASSRPTAHPNLGFLPAAMSRGGALLSPPSHTIGRYAPQVRQTLWDGNRQAPQSHTETGIEGAFYLGDCVEMMAGGRRERRRLIVTSPPHNMGIRTAPIRFPLRDGVLLRWTSLAWRWRRRRAC